MDEKKLQHLADCYQVMSEIFGIFEKHDTAPKVAIICLSNIMIQTAKHIGMEKEQIVHEISKVWDENQGDLQ